MLTAEHAENLARFRITPELLEAAGVRSVSDLDTREMFGVNGSYPGKNLGGILFPTLDSEGRRTGGRVRLDDSIDGMKYYSEQGNKRLFFAPGASESFKDQSVTAVLAEGEKGALSIAAWCQRSGRKYLIIATGGVDGWKRKREKVLTPDGDSVWQTGPSVDFDLVTWKGRSALIAFDSNATTNPNVRRSRNAVRKELVARGAAVSFVEIPAEDGINGPDDLIAIRGDEAMLAAFDQSSGEADTLRRLVRSDSGKAKPSLANVITVLRDATDWVGVLAFNEFSLHTVARRPPPWSKVVDSNWADVDDTWATDWLQRNAGLDVNSQTVAEAVQAVAALNPFHPVKQYLERLVWDEKPRIDCWLSTYVGADDNTYTRAIGPRWLISGVARIFKPGCQADHTLMIEGRQGKLKSTALRTLAGDEWFTDNLDDIESKDGRMGLHGKWIIEFSELSNIHRSHKEKVKAFLTARFDHFRPPYARRPIDVPRSNVFAATTNDSNPFSDETGNRRFWPVRCGRIDVGALVRDRDQLWAEAFQRYENGGRWYLDSDSLNALAAEEQDERYEPGPWDEIILAWLDQPRQRTIWVDNPAYKPEKPEDARPKNEVPLEPFDSNSESVTVTDVLIHAIGKRPDTFSMPDRKQVTRCLTHAGWTEGRRTVTNGRKLRFFMRPS